MGWSLHHGGQHGYALHRQLLCALHSIHIPLRAILFLVRLTPPPSHLTCLIAVHFNERVLLVVLVHHSVMLVVSFTHPLTDVLFLTPSLTFTPFLCSLGFVPCGISLWPYQRLKLFARPVFRSSLCLISPQKVNAFETLNSSSSSSNQSADSFTGRPPVFSWGSDLSKYIEPHRQWQFHGIVRDGFTHVK